MHKLRTDKGTKRKENVDVDGEGIVCVKWAEVLKAMEEDEKIKNNHHTE